MDENVVCFLGAGASNQDLLVVKQTEKDFAFRMDLLCI